NARWGDPEAEVLLPAIQTDYTDIIEATLGGNLTNIAIKIDNLIRVSIAGCSMGYPNDYSAVKGKRIYGIEEARKLPGIIIFGAGIAFKNNHLVANGGRVFHVVGEGLTLLQARVRAYGALGMISIQDNN